MSEEKKDLKPYELENGRVYMMPSDHCIFCKNNTDIIYDYTNGPYCFFCELGKNYKNGCDSFEFDGYEFDEKDYKKRMGG